MAAEASIDFYAVLGLKKECTDAELRNAYKKLAMKWHPDRCSASGNLKFIEESKKKFQAIQQAYSVLSDDNKRFLYDVGIYDCNDDNDENGMGDFLNEMATIMSETKSNENGKNETFEDLQELFDEMFQSDDIIDTFGCSSRSATTTIPSRSSSSQASFSGTYNGISNKKNSTEINSGNLRAEAMQFQQFCIGTCGKSRKHQNGESSRRKNTRKGNRYTMKVQNWR